MLAVSTRRQRSPDEWLGTVRAIQSWESGGLRAPHKPLLLLLALGHLQRSGKAAVAFSEAEDPLKELLREYSPTGTWLHPEYPFFYLQNDGLWQLERLINVPPGRSPSAGQLRSANAVGSRKPTSIADSRWFTVQQ
jgi:putative restriction endonuclease